MDDLSQSLKRARDQIRVDWSEAQSHAVERALPQLRRRRVMRRAMVSAVLMLAALAGRQMLHTSTPHPDAVVTQAPSATKPAVERDTSLHLADGSFAVPLSSDAQLRTVTQTAQRCVIDLARGGARFVVVHDPSRVFRVEAGAVAVEVLGTVFSVERQAEGVRVAVERGRVRVIYAGQRIELTDGQARLFESEPIALPAPIAKAEATRTSRAPIAAPVPAPSPSPDWHRLATDGDFDGAYEALARRGFDTLHDDPAELLLAADVARLSHNPRAAVAPLERLLRDHAADPRAPLAAFTLGRILLEDLGQPSEAAQAFAAAQRLSSEGVLAPDALAREVEAWSRAGDQAKARARAEDYLRRFPTGSRTRSVRRYGGLE